MDSINKKSSSEFLPALESARGIAALMVVIYHYSYRAGGDNLKFFCRNFYLSVELFFMLSGFLMGKIYLDKINGPGSLFNFLLLRLGRIWPLHMFWVIVFLAMFLFQQHGSLTVPQMNLLWPTLLLIQGDDHTMWNYPSWSIAAEWVSYCLFGFHIFLFHKKPKWVNTLIIGSISLLAYILLAQKDTSMKYMTPTQGFLSGIGGFYLGVLGFVYLKNFKLPKYTGWVFLFIFIYLFTHNDINNFPPNYCFTILAIIGVVWLSGQEAQKTLLANPSLVYLGTVSYSVYLGHAFVDLIIYKLFERNVIIPVDGFQFYGLLISKLMILYFLAHLTHKFIENPFRRLARNWVSRWT
jgi:peptidoglycan/LPS O-acetylase OafA/YrhL